jgi:nucleotide-binding universal stress UspA family protein
VTAANVSPEAILVAMDFSPGSLRALDMVLARRAPGADITLLHVVDTSIVERITRVGLMNEADVLAKMKSAAEREMEALIAERSLEGAQPMIVQGVPFVEIVKVARDLDLDLIVVGLRGTAGMEHVLFGGTAEKVLRTASRPVLCVP